MTFKDFISFYAKYGKCPNDIQKRSQKLSNIQLESRYNKYMQTQQKRKNRLEKNNNTLKKKERKIDEQWEELKGNLDFTECLFLKKLKSSSEYTMIDIIKERGGFLLKTIDPAHVFSRSGYPHLKYEPRNVVPLNRYSHSMLDTMRSPISGRPITKEERDEYWELIVGTEKYRELKKLAKRERGVKYD